VRTLDGVADDWPLTYTQLEPFFDLNDRMMGIAGITGDPVYPPKSPRQVPPIPLGKLGQTIVEGGQVVGILTTTDLMESLGVLLQREEKPQYVLC
jgi:hypothetical protein